VKGGKIPQQLPFRKLERIGGDPHTKNCRPTVRGSRSGNYCSGGKDLLVGKNGGARTYRKEEATIDCITGGESTGSQ